MKRKIIVNNKEFTMPKMSIDTYTEYLELAEVIDAKQRYSKQDIEAKVNPCGDEKRRESPVLWIL